MKRDRTRIDMILLFAFLLSYALGGDRETIKIGLVFFIACKLAYLTDRE